MAGCFILSFFICCMFINIWVCLYRGVFSDEVKEEVPSQIKYEIGFLKI